MCNVKSDTTNGSDVRFGWARFDHFLLFIFIDINLLLSTKLIPGLVPFYRQLLPMFNAYKSFEGMLENAIPRVCIIRVLLMHS